MKCFNRFDSIERHHRNRLARIWRRAVGFLLLLPALALAQPGPGATFSDDNWISMGGFPGVNGPVYAAVVDGSGNLYIGGSFTVVGEVVVDGVAKWDGSRWSALSCPNGIEWDHVSALAVSGSDLYVAGFFTTAGGVWTSGIAKWDGSCWSALSSSDSIGPSYVSALAVSGSNVYAGFLTQDGGVTSGIAKWDGSNWSVLGTGFTNDYGCGDYCEPFVLALAVSGSDVYAAGSFTTGDGVPASKIAKWDGTKWSALGSGLEKNDGYGGVSALAVSGGDLYAGGDFTTAGGIAANSIAKWDGSRWLALGTGISSADWRAVQALAVSGSDLYVGGSFTMAGGIAATNIAKWDGTNWSALASGVSEVSALAVLGSDLYVAGFFTAITEGGTAAHAVVKWDGSSWSPLGLGSGIDGGVLALAVSGGDLYAGGAFTTAGGIAANSIAKWDGTHWSILGSANRGIEWYSGHSGSALELTVSGSDLYAGGRFRTAGGIAATNIAKWDGTNWSALGSGLERYDVLNGFVGSVSALAVSGSNVYAGGQFSMAGGIAARNIAKWNGTNWSALGSGLERYDVYDGFVGWVSALVVSGGDLYAGGDFTTAGGIAANSIAKWDGTKWSALGSGLRSDNGSPVRVSALAVSGGDLYAGGDFATAGGIAANSIAKWDGSKWSAVGSGINGGVSALAVSGSDLYVGGGFMTAGGIAAKNIAKWDGTNWSALGSGVNGWVSALAVLGGDLYAGGHFFTAGGKVSPYLARAVIARPANVISSFLGGADFVARFDGTPGATYTIEYADTLSPATWRKATNLTVPNVDQGMGVGVFEFRDSTTDAPQRFYRAVYPSY